MENVITNEFIQYKSGFIEGKNEIVDAHRLGKVLDLSNLSDGESTNQYSWYQSGFEDGFNYFSNLIGKEFIDLKRASLNKIIQDCFINRVVSMNQEYDSEIPMAKFKI